MEVKVEKTAPAHDPLDPARPAQFDDTPKGVSGPAMPNDHVSDGKVAPPLATREEEERLRVAEVQRAQHDAHGSPLLDARYSGKVIPAHARRDLIEMELAKIVGYPVEVAHLRELIGGL